MTTFFKEMTIFNRTKTPTTPNLVVMEILLSTILVVLIKGLNQFLFFNDLERFILFSENIFNTWRVHLFICPDQNWSKIMFDWIQLFSKHGLVQNIFLIIQWVSLNRLPSLTGHMFKKIKKRIIIIHLKENNFSPCPLLIFLFDVTGTVPIVMILVNIAHLEWNVTERFTEPYWTVKKTRVQALIFIIPQALTW